MCPTTGGEEVCVEATETSAPEEKEQAAATPADEPQAVAPPPEEEEDEVARLQSVDSFSTLEDGQPTPPGHLEYRMAGGIDHGLGGGFGYDAEPELEFTPRSPSAFLENFQVLGAVELEGETGEFAPSANLGWCQRWIKDGGEGSWVPTIGTLTELNMPFKGGFAPGLVGDNVVETVTIAKMVGPGSFYLNGEATGVLAGDTEARGLLLGMRAGYKWNAIDDKLAVILDYTRDQNEVKSGRDINLGELSLQWELGEHLTLGPGIAVGLDDNPDTPRIGGGVMFLIE